MVLLKGKSQKIITSIVCKSKLNNFAYIDHNRRALCTITRVHDTKEILHLPLPSEWEVEQCSIMINNRVLIEWGPLESRYFKFCARLARLINDFLYLNKWQDVDQKIYKQFYRSLVNFPNFKFFTTSNAYLFNIEVASCARMVGNKNVAFALLHDYLLWLGVLNCGDEEFSALPSVQRHDICNLDLSKFFIYRYQYEMFIKILEMYLEEVKSQGYDPKFLYPLLNITKEEMKDAPEDHYFIVKESSIRKKIKKQFAI